MQAMIGQASHMEALRLCPAIAAAPRAICLGLLLLTPAVGADVSRLDAAPDVAGVLLADGRDPGQAGDLREWSAQPAVLAASREAETFWRARNPVYEHDYRVVATAAGAFTGAATTQTAVLYLLSRWPRALPNMGLVILDADGQLLHSYAFEASMQELAAAPDIDGDGLDELLLTGSFGMGGDNQSHITLLSLRDGGPQQLAEAVLATDSCASGSGERGSTAFRLTLLPGPLLHSEQFRRSCEESAQWQAVSSETMPFGEPVDWFYTVLSVAP